MTEVRGPRVLHLDHTSAAGGAELALRRMLLAAPTWRPLVLLPRAPLGAFLPLNGVVPVRRVGRTQPAGVSSGRLASLVAASHGLLLQAALTRFDPAFRSADIVDANTARSAAYGALAARTSRVPFVVHLRDVVDAEALGSAGFATMTRLVLPRADGIIANSRSTLRSAGGFVRGAALQAVIPSAAGLRPVRDRSPRRRGSLTVGMAARLDPWKGQVEVLEAFARAFAHGTERLQLAGDALFGHEEYRDHLRRRAAELGIERRVDLLGHVDDVDRLLAEWDIAVQYSTRPEPLGQNVLQYLAAGCATVVADEGGPAEWVMQGVNGLRVPPRDIGALAEALRRLGHDEALRRALADAAPTTADLLPDTAVAEEHARFYAELLLRRGPRNR